MTFQQTELAKKKKKKNCPRAGPCPACEPPVAALILEHQVPILLVEKTLTK